MKIITIQYLYNKTLAVIPGFLSVEFDYAENLVNTKSDLENPFLMLTGRYGDTGTRGHGDTGTRGHGE